MTIELDQRGHLEIPKALRDQFGIQSGQRYAIRVLEGGVVVFTPRSTSIAEAMAKLQASLLDQGANRDEMLAELRRMREAGPE